MPSISSVLDLLRQCPTVIAGRRDNGVEVMVPLTGNTRLLLLTLALNGTPYDGTVCTLSRSDLMRLTAMCKATLDTHIGVLKDAGFLFRRKEKQKIDGIWRNIWRLDLTPLRAIVAATPSASMEANHSRAKTANVKLGPTPELVGLVCEDERVIEEVESLIARIKIGWGNPIKREYLRGHEEYCIAEVKKRYPDVEIHSFPSEILFIVPGAG